MADPGGDLERLVAGVSSGERLALARAITLVESELEADRELGRRLVEALLSHSEAAVRVAVSGAPGVGKSTLIDALGRHIIERSGSVAVLAVDPSSQRTGGSVLGDKTRLGRLAASTKSFIRPSPSGGFLFPLLDYNPPTNSDVGAPDHHRGRTR